MILFVDSISAQPNIEKSRALTSRLFLLVLSVRSDGQQTRHCSRRPTAKQARTVMNTRAADNDSCRRLDSIFSVERVHALTSRLINNLSDSSDGQQTRRCRRRHKDQQQHTQDLWWISGVVMMVLVVDSISLSWGVALWQASRHTDSLSARSV